MAEGEIVAGSETFESRMERQLLGQFFDDLCEAVVMAGVSGREYGVDNPREVEILDRLKPHKASIVNFAHSRSADDLKANFIEMFVMAAHELKLQRRFENSSPVKEKGRQVLSALLNFRDPRGEFQSLVDLLLKRSFGTPELEPSPEVGQIGMFVKALQNCPVPDIARQIKQMERTYESDSELYAYAMEQLIGMHDRLSAQTVVQGLSRADSARFLGFLRKNAVPLEKADFAFELYTLGSGNVAISKPGKPANGELLGFPLSFIESYR